VKTRPAGAVRVCPAEKNHHLSVLLTESRKASLESKTAGGRNGNNQRGKNQNSVSAGELNQRQEPNFERETE
jgi:hypothetical protein